jgi:hypothetical protein
MAEVSETVLKFDIPLKKNLRQLEKRVFWRINEN